MGTGIDYGCGKTNIDTETDIRYGVIPYNCDPGLLQFWADTSDPIYVNACPKCGTELDGTSDVCHACDYVIQDSDADEQEPVGYKIENETYVATVSGDDTDIFVIKSPYFTYAQFCSPCAPGACYLLDPLEAGDNNRAYCFGHECFERGIAPYPVYSVESGRRVFPERMCMMAKQQVYTIHDVISAGCTLTPMQCVHCGHVGETTYNQQVGDALCEECGRWQLEKSEDTKSAIDRYESMRQHSETVKEVG